ncbi:MAG TPA: cellulase family glycosylhydrolase [Acidimicrobiales bacterium]|nr:cellulase family glycosylhydrolase [Acidimicrobiales bacterium]
MAGAAAALITTAGALVVGTGAPPAAAATTTTTTAAPRPSTTTTASTPTTAPSTTTTSARASTTTSTTAPLLPAPAPVGATTTTTPEPPHVTHQPNVDALSPHIEALSGKGIEYQFSSGATSTPSPAGVPSYLSSPGGPYLYDSDGRVVLMHGTNVVYKHPPYIAYPDPGQPWNFTSQDAAMMQKLGFSIVRLGIEWQGLEPGSGGPNQPQICTPGTPGNPNEFNAAIANAYLNHVSATVKLLAHYGIYTLLDMHQDVYNTLFRGEGAPQWAVCTNNVPIVPKGGRWSTNYSNPTLQTAVGHFWANDVVGNLQGQYDLVWKTVANYFKNNKWVVGYDPFNEPFSTETQTAAGSTFTGQLQCFYTGSAHTGFLANGQTLLNCPPGDPANGVIPTIQSVDSHHLIFTEPDIYWVTGGNVPSQLGPMPFQRVVFNFHVYCGDRSPITGNPTNLLRCLESEETAASEQDVTRLSMSSKYQPSGPGIFMSEFGATTSPELAGFDTEWAGLDDVGWAYWAWKYYDDPTGSSAEGLVLPDGSYSPIVGELSRTYPQETAGVPSATVFNPFTGAFGFNYTPGVASKGDTVIAIAAQQHYPNGWCAAVRGGRITSAPGSTRLTIATEGKPQQVYVTVTAGACPSKS